MIDISVTQIRREIITDNKVRIGINASNFLLVSNIDEQGIPHGIAPDLGRLFAKKLNAIPEFHVFENTGKLADAGLTESWDIAFLGNEPQRAKDIAFSAPYLEIPVTCLVPKGSDIRTLEEVDKPGTRISVMNRSAYDLFLTNTLKNATLVRAKSIDESFSKFKSEKLEVLAGLKPRLVSDSKNMTGSIILEGQMTSVKQSAGTLPKNSATAVFLHHFIEEAKRKGMVQDLINKYSIKGVVVSPLKKET